MNPANAVTSFRLFASPLFFVAAALPAWTGRFEYLSVVSLWVLFVAIEITDVLDGAVARRMGLVSDMGKLLDPFADVISRLTYFVVFALLDVMPGWMVILVMYREIGIMFVRMVMYRDGIALAARRGGKAKAVVYATAGGFGILVVTARFVGWSPEVLVRLERGAVALFGAAVLFAWVSFIDYLVVFRAHARDRSRS